MDRLNDEQHEVLAALIEAWQQEQDGLDRIHDLHVHASELLNRADASGVPAHLLARAFLRTRARRTTVCNIRKAQMLLRKRRSRDLASRRSAGVD